MRFRPKSESGPHRLASRAIGAAALGWALHCGAASAFPVADPTNPGVVPQGADLAQPDVQDLRHQMALLSGFGAAGAGWTILPRLSWEEEFTDNVLEEPRPRKADIVSVLAPGVAVLGDLPRIQIRLNYQPTLEMHVTEGSQNVLSQQLNADGLITAVPDAVFVDVRGVSGVQATNGGIGGLGGLGQAGVGPITGGGLIGNDQLGLAKQNRSLTTSFTVAPYVLQHYGDIGDAKLGISLNRSSSATTTGFAPLPFAASGTNSLQESIIEETGTFTSGPEFGRTQDAANIDAQQTQASGFTGGASTRDVGTNRLTYAINTSVSVYGTIGWEYIKYTGGNRLNIDDMVWQVGGTWTPNADSSITAGYGHQNGQNSLTFSGHYALSARTTITGSYTNGVGTQLEQVAHQLDLGAVGNNGNFLNSQTGGELFAANNAEGVAPGVYQFNTLTLGATTVLDRDSISLYLSSNAETQVGTTTPNATNTVRTATANWTHVLNPDLNLSAEASYSLGTPLGTIGSTRSLAARLSLQYTLSETVSTFASYSYLRRDTDTQGQSFYQDLVIVGLTKQF